MTIMFLLTGCCGVFCERQKHAETIIKKVEIYKQETGKLPESIREVGMGGEQDHLSSYYKLGDRYWVSYEGRSGVIYSYNSMKKKWSRIPPKDDN